MRRKALESKRSNGQTTLTVLVSTENCWFVFFFKLNLNIQEFPCKIIKSDEFPEIIVFDTVILSCKYMCCSNPLLEFYFSLLDDIMIFLLTELIEMKGKGIFDLLDEESKLPTPKPDHFTMEVHNRNKDHFRLSVSVLGLLGYVWSGRNGAWTFICKTKTTTILLGKTITKILLQFDRVISLSVL